MLLASEAIGLAMVVSMVLILVFEASVLALDLIFHAENGPCFRLENTPLLAFEAMLLSGLVLL